MRLVLKKVVDVPYIGSDILKKQNLIYHLELEALKIET